MSVSDQALSHSLVARTTLCLGKNKLARLQSRETNLPSALNARREEYYTSSLDGGRDDGGSAVLPSPALDSPTDVPRQLRDKSNLLPAHPLPNTFQYVQV